MALDMQAICWLLLLVILVLIEALTLGLTTIWFAAGAAAACLLSIFGQGIWVQLIAFCAVSFVLLVLTRPLAMKRMKKEKTPTNADGVIGQAAVVTEMIDNLAGKGAVQVRGQEWTARSGDDAKVIPAGTRVTVEAIKGVKLIVKEELS